MIVFWIAVAVVVTLVIFGTVAESRLLTGEKTSNEEISSVDDDIQNLLLLTTIINSDTTTHNNGEI